MRGGKMSAADGVKRQSIMAALVCASTSCALADDSAIYQFNFVPAQSGLNATANNALGASGTLIGNYNADTNPTGTRTKPGLFGTFGATENLPVNVNTLGVSLSGAINTDTTGSFSLTIDTTANTISMSGYSANFLGNGAASLPVNLNLSTETFRTRNPTFLYPAIPLSIPFGSATISTFNVTQVGAGLGTLTPTGPGTFSFIVTPLVNLELAVSVLGNDFSVPGQAPLPFALQGTLTLNGNSATISSVTPIDISQSGQPSQALPEFPLALPTTGDPANVLLNLTLSQATVGLTGTANTFATGTLVPAPGAAAALVAIGVVATRRRRTARA
jgi:hypothetical protein